MQHMIVGIFVVFFECKQRETKVTSLFVCTRKRKLRGVVCPSIMFENEKRRTIKPTTVRDFENAKYTKVRSTDKQHDGRGLLG